MRRYETIIIFDPDTSEEKRISILDKVGDLVKQHSGLLVETDDWGIKKVAYEIKKKSRGHYIRLDFCSEVTLIKEMEYLFRINDNVLKFMTLVLEKEANLEAIKNILSDENQDENLEHKINQVEED